jgi:hypothetical protein
MHKPVDLSSAIHQHVGDVSPHLSVTWGLCIATFGGPRDTFVPYSDLPSSWYEGAFSDGYGIEEYIRQMSGGRESITREVFGHVELMPISEKLALDQEGLGALAQGLRAAAAAKGIPVDSVDRFMWVFNDGQSSSGLALSGADSLLGAFDFTLQNACHEMMHQYGVPHHADSYGEKGNVEEYGDPFCIMGEGPRARSFQNIRLTALENDRTHATCGPGLCAPYLVQAGWAKHLNHVLQLPWEWLEQDQHEIVLSANFGAPPPDQSRWVAIAFGSASAAASPYPQQWIEYRTPINRPPAPPSPIGPPSNHAGFDQRIDTPVTSDTADLPEEGGLILHEVRDEGGLHAIFLSAVRAEVGARIPFRRASTQGALEVTKIDMAAYPPRVTLSTVAT